MKEGERSDPNGLPVIGWREWLALPELGVARIKAKVDTGARSSALHASEVELFDRGALRIVRFRVHALQRGLGAPIGVETPLLEMRNVRSSDGRVERRPVIVTKLSLMGSEWPIELTLTSRDMMGFRMLLGRQAVRGRFTVDPARSYYDGRLTRRKRTRYKERES